MVSTRSRLTLENPPQTGPQTLLTQPLENFKAAVLRVASDNLHRRLMAEEITRIEEKITENAHTLSHTPDHPPYATMIRIALLELNEEGGSSEDSISDFIKSEFSDLPWAHSAYLKHYLCKLCNRSEIFLNSENLYLLVDENNPNAASSDWDRPKTEVREIRGKSCKKGNKPKEKESTGGLEVVMLEEQNEVIKEQNQEQHEHEPMRIKFRFSENQSTRKTVQSDLPLALEDQNEQNVHAFDQNTKKIQGRRENLYRNKNPEEATSTSALILNLAQSTNQPKEKVKGQGRGRPRKNDTFGESEAENPQPRPRGRPWKEDRGIEGKRQQPKHPGRPRKVDS